MASSFCRATTRRVENERPSRMGSTSKSMGIEGSPARRKYACRLWALTVSDTVWLAAIKHCATTCPPKIRFCGIRLSPIKLKSPVWRGEMCSSTSVKPVTWVANTVVGCDAVGCDAVGSRRAHKRKPKSSRPRSDRYPRSFARHPDPWPRSAHRLAAESR